MYSFLELLLESDRELFRLIYRGLRPAGRDLHDKVDHFFIFANSLGEFFVLVPLLVILLLNAQPVRRYFPQMLMLLIGVGIGAGVVGIVKKATERTRPNDAFSVHFVGQPPTWGKRPPNHGHDGPEKWLHEYLHIRTDTNDVDAAIITNRGFPSGHTQFAFAIAAAIAFWFPRGAFAIFLWAWLCGVGRIYGGMHFPLDVVVGALVGWAAMALSFGLARGLVRWSPGQSQGLPGAFVFTLPLWGPLWLAWALGGAWPPAPRRWWHLPYALVWIAMHVVLLPFRVVRLALRLLGLFILLLGDLLREPVCGEGETWRGWLALGLPAQFPHVGRQERRALSWRVVLAPVLVTFALLEWLGCSWPMPMQFRSRGWFITVVWWLVWPALFVLAIPLHVVWLFVRLLSGRWFLPPMPQRVEWWLRPFVGVYWSLRIGLLPVWIVRWPIVFLARDESGRQRRVWAQWWWDRVEPIDGALLRGRRVAGTIGCWLAGAAYVLVLCGIIWLQLRQPDVFPPWLTCHSG
ncbi:MAG: phosphatase PAP2 family protein [Planctomycetota bacterium]